MKNKNTLVCYLVSSIVTLLFPSLLFACQLNYGGKQVNVNCGKGTETAAALYDAYRYLKAKNDIRHLEDMCWTPYMKAKELAKNQHLYGDMAPFMQPLVSQCNHGLNIAGN